MDTNSNRSARPASDEGAAKLYRSLLKQAGGLPGTPGSRITGEIALAAEPARFAPFPDHVPPALLGALRQRGIAELYSHQREAFDAAEAGRNVVVVTPTASGKSLCYNLPVLTGVVSSGARALYLFPTKALSQDQVTELNEINAAAGLGVRAFTFDGDTPSDARKAVRSRGDIVVSNPDMLHQAVLPHHTKWAPFFESLRYVVIDELHTYRGVFGAHVANVIRRLRRVLRFYACEPVFITCSATIANPRALAERLVGAPVTLVDRSGAPRGERRLLLWNPPVVNPDLGIRASARSQSVRIARAAVEHRRKTIVFARTRTMVEVITKYLKDKFDHDPRKPARVRAYRGGYLPGERRRTEKELRSGDVDCVVSTNALELGVDIGALDACVLNGYPGSIAATWQRFGRAGRRQRSSIGVLVAGSDALDQYIVRNPAFFADATPEHARIEPDQLLILLDHVRCAAFELPFRAADDFGIERSLLHELLQVLVEEGVVHRDGDPDRVDVDTTQWHWIADSYPANAVSLRTVAEGNFVVIDIGEGQQKVIAEVDYSGVPMTLYEGAIYMIQAQPWQVEKLDWAGRKAFVRRTEADYYTDAIDYTRLKILDPFERDGAGHHGECAHGEVHLVRRVPGYKKIRFYTHENIGYGNIDLPDQEMHTTAVWWRLPAAVLDEHFATRQQALEAFLGAAHALHVVAALLLMSEQRDIGRSVGDANGAWFVSADRDGRAQVRTPDGKPSEGVLPAFDPTAYLYDDYPGGIGLSEPLYGLAERAVREAAELVGGCDCLQGCPSCVGPATAAQEGERGGSQKARALMVLRLLGASAAHAQYAADELPSAAGWH